MLRKNFNFCSEYLSFLRKWKTKKALSSSLSRLSQKVISYINLSFPRKRGSRIGKGHSIFLIVQAESGFRFYCFFSNVQPNDRKQLKTASWRKLWLISTVLKSGGTKAPGIVVQVVCPVGCWLQLVVEGCWYPGLTSILLKIWGYICSALISQCWESV